MFSSLCQDREVCFMSGTTATVIVNHRSQELLLLHFGATVFYGLSCLRGLQTLFQSGRPRHLSSTLAEQSNSEDVSLSMPGSACQGVSVVMCD